MIRAMEHWDRVPIQAQSVDAPLSRAAVFLVLEVVDDAAIRDVLGAVGDLVKNVGFRDLNGRLSCVVGIGSALWDRLATGAGGRRSCTRSQRSMARCTRAPSTPGDLLFHIRAEREDMTFELERQLLDVIGDAARVVDETVGFRYFDARDLLGFVDGTANPTGAELPEAALIGDEDPEFAGGSYVVVQKYLHDMAGWARLTAEQQEAIIGRTKLDNIELDDDDAPRKSHKTLATIEAPDGGELAILRDNMPFGRPGAGEFGTYFIGYAGRLWVIEKMLERMFVGEPAGAYDRLLDFSTAVTGTTFFVPTAALLETLAEPPAEPTRAGAGGSDASLGIGSLRAT